MLLFYTVSIFSLVEVSFSSLFFFFLVISCQIDVVVTKGKLLQLKIVFFVEIKGKELR